MLYNYYIEQKLNGGAYMYFVNMCDEEGLGTFRGINDVPFENTVTGTQEGYVTIKDKKLVVGTTGKNLFETGITNSDEPYLPALKTELTCKDVMETEENPLIIVLCDYIEVYDKVPANIKFIHLDDGRDDKILAMLVYGACGFNGVPMQRCNNADIEGKKSKVLRSKDIKGITNSKDKESGYDFLMDAVIQLAIKFTDSSAGHCISGKMCTSGNENFNIDKMMNYREHMKLIERQRQLKKQQEEEERRRRKLQMEEERRKAEEARKKAEEEQRQAELEKALLKANNKKEEKKEKEVSVGAKEFLAALGVH